MPKPRKDEEDKSLQALTKHIRGRDPTLGAMAFMHSVDHDAFGDDLRFPNGLTERFRNRAMHVDERNADDYKSGQGLPVRGAVQIAHLSRRGSAKPA